MTSMEDALIMVDERSIVEGFSHAVKALTAKERHEVFSQLPNFHVEKFGSLGYCHERPAQIISPFEVPPVTLRRKWIDVFFEVRGPASEIWGAMYYQTGSRFFTLLLGSAKAKGQAQ